MGRLMDFTTETPNCCEIGDILQVEENKLPTSYWYMIEHAMVPVAILKTVND